MNLYLAVSHTKQHIQMMKRLSVRNMLISFHYFKSFDTFLEYTENWLPENLIIDSGAFSVWTAKGTIDIDEYIAFCKTVQIKVKQYNEEKKAKTNVYFVNLDVLPGNYGRIPSATEREESASKGWENMIYITHAGIRVIPVYHQHEDIRWLKRMMTFTDYIGISPANDASQKSKQVFLSNVFAITKADVKTHGFAVTSLDTLLKFPFYSGDSSSWAAGGRYARIPVFKGGKFSSVEFKDKTQVSKLFKNSRIKSTELFNSYMLRMEQGILAYQDAEKFITNVWLQRGIKWD